MKPLRARFAKDIVAEFLPSKKPSKKVIIFTSGMPSVPKLTEVLNFYSKKGFWVFHPRYRGSWESSGSFLKHSPEKDLLDVIDGILNGFTDILNKKKYSIKFKKLYLFGGSFGGPAAILASRDQRVNKAIALSPVIDWGHLGRAEPIDEVLKYTREAFGEAYRINNSNWEKLKSGSFYSPAYHAKEIDGSKLLIFQAKDDESIPWKPTVKFCRSTGTKLELWKKGGHLSSSMFMNPRIHKNIKSFLK